MAQLSHMNIARAQSFLLLGAAAVAAAIIAFASPAPFAYAQYCAQDAMQCPDGTYVGRTGSNCEFVCPPGGTIAPPVGTVDPSNPIIKDLQPIPAGSGEIVPAGVSGGSDGYPTFETAYPEPQEAPRPGTVMSWEELQRIKNNPYSNIAPPVGIYQGPYSNFPGEIAPPVGIYQGPETNYRDTEHPFGEIVPASSGDFFGSIGNWFSGLFSWFW
jgi:hypothetical protein